MHPSRYAHMHVVLLSSHIICIYIDIHLQITYYQAWAHIVCPRGSLTVNAYPVGEHPNTSPRKLVGDQIWRQGNPSWVRYRSHKGLNNQHIREQLAYMYCSITGANFELLFLLVGCRIVNRRSPMPIIYDDPCYFTIEKPTLDFNDGPMNMDCYCSIAFSTHTNMTGLSLFQFHGLFYYLITQGYEILHTTTRLFSPKNYRRLSCTILYYSMLAVWLLRALPFWFSHTSHNYHTMPADYQTAMWKTIYYCHTIIAWLESKLLLSVQPVISSSLTTFFLGFLTITIIFTGFVDEKLTLETKA